MWSTLQCKVNAVTAAYHLKIYPFFKRNRYFTIFYIFISEKLRSYIIGYSMWLEYITDADSAGYNIQPKIGLPS